MNNFCKPQCTSFQLFNLNMSLWNRKQIEHLLFWNGGVGGWGGGGGGGGGVGGVISGYTKYLVQKIVP